MGRSMMDSGNFDKHDWMLSDLDRKIQAERLVSIADVKDNLYCCEEFIQQLVYLAKYAHTHDNLLPEYKDLMNHYAKQIEMVMGWKL